MAVHDIIHIEGVLRKMNLDKLEYNKIIGTLENYAKSELGKKQIKTLKPSFDVGEVASLQLQTSEAVKMIQQYGNPPIDSFADVSLHLKKLESNTILSTREILDLAHILKMSRELLSFFEEATQNLHNQFTPLVSFFGTLFTHHELEKQIFLKIIDENTIDDNASSTLYSIRKAQQSLERSIKDKLNHFLHSATYSKYLQEPVITMRDNRYVIPVKDEYRSQISGLIHDISSSGSTVFIEPTSIFDMNNEINTLKIKEGIEIEKILASLTNQLASIRNFLENTVQLLKEIDVLFAKANYGIAIHGISPTISHTKDFHLLKARHPLIEKDKVVPITVSLGKNFTTLVVTGPNTGGKTVTLKTVGLLHLMAYTGLMIPAHENSSIYVFDHIFADMGDEQSIAESLSTFSGHMKNLIEITHTATCQSLILLDELGSGTDPIEGSALAISLLEFFHTLGSLCMATTHYQEIKNYALTHEEYQNASVEFDVENLKPTYQFILGIPGKSNAFAISEKLGLSKKILDRAVSLINSNDTKIEDVLKNIYDRQKQIEIEKETIEANSKEIEQLRKNLQRDNSIVKNQEKEIIENAKMEAREILLEAKDEATRIIREMNAISSDTNSLKELNNYRNDLNNAIHKVNQTEFKKEKKNSLVANQLSKGTKVLITDMNQSGTIIGQVKGHKVQVQAGNTKLTVDISNLDLDTSLPKDPEKKISSSTMHLKPKNISNEINVISLTVDEAIPIVDKFLDDCSLSSLDKVRIVHGKGTGKLRQGIHNYLKNHSHVKSFRLGTFGEGEMGVTIVELKK